MLGCQYGQFGQIQGERKKTQNRKYIHGFSERDFVLIHTHAYIPSRHITKYISVEQVFTHLHSADVGS